MTFKSAYLLYEIAVERRKAVRKLKESADGLVEDRERDLEARRKSKSVFTFSDPELKDLKAAAEVVAGELEAIETAIAELENMTLH